MKRLHLSRHLASWRRFASRDFTNRDSLLDRVDVEVHKVLAESTYFRVLSFYGMGGIGKTSLLKQLFLRNDPRDLAWVTVDLESGAVQTSTDVLYEIYRSSGVRYFPFEYALALIWERRGLSIHDIRNRLVAVSAGWSDFGDAALEAMSAGVNLPAVLRLSDKLADVMRRRHHDAEVRAIDASTDSERERLLPGLLARAIEAEANKQGRSLVVAVDSLDSLSRKPGFGEGGEPPDNWLQELLAQAQCGLWLLAGREKLRWQEELPDWNDASALLGRCNDGQRLAREGLQVQQRTGYLSGQLFALCALALNQYRMGSTEATEATRDEIVRVEQRIGVYLYHRALLDYCFDEERRPNVSELARWLDYSASRRALNEVAARMRR